VRGRRILRTSFAGYWMILYLLLQVCCPRC
jgi:hypothetical protein